MFRPPLDPIEIAMLGLGIIAGLALFFVDFPSIASDFQRLVALAV
jgi:hypothetical protein